MGGGGLSKWLQYYIGGGLAKWLQYYIGVVRQMITVLHGGGVSNDYGTPWILGCYIRNIISRDLTKKSDFFSVGKKSFLGVRSKSLQLYRGGICPNDYNITWGGSLGTPKSDYVICARPLRVRLLGFEIFANSLGRRLLSVLNNFFVAKKSPYRSNLLSLTQK